MSAGSNFAVNEPRDVVQNFLNCLKTRTLCDIVLVAGSEEIPCHRFILSASSNVFHAMLTNNCWSEFSSKRVELHEPDECNAVFEQFIRYMYSGQIDVPLLKVLPLLLLADKYNVRSLVNYCWQHMLSHLINSVRSNCIFDWISYAKGYGRHDMNEAFHRFVRLNFEFVAYNTNLDAIDLETFCSIIAHTDLVVTNECTLFAIAGSWLEHQFKHVTDETERKKIVLTVLGCIRYPMMSSRQLAALTISPFAQKYNEFLVNRMARGMSFHHGRLSNKDLKNEHNGFLQIYPRIYTEDAVSSQVAVEWFKKLPKHHKLTMVFSTNTSSAECDGEKICEWVIELSLKGIIIEQGLLISHEIPYTNIIYPNLTVPGCEWKKNRLSITCKDPPPGENLRVRICTLLYGTQNSQMYVVEHKELVHHFNEENRMVHINDILPYDDADDMLLNTGNCRAIPQLERYFVGADRDSISLRVVIVPLPVLHS